MPMINHEQARIIERRAEMREHIECELPCSIAGYKWITISTSENYLNYKLTSTWANSSKWQNLSWEKNRAWVTGKSWIMSTNQQLGSLYHL